MICWDTSALLRCYEENQPSYGHAKNLLLREKGHVASALIRVETASGIQRRFSRDKARLDSLRTLLEAHLKEFDLLPVVDRVLDLGIRLVKKHALRAGDAIHLSSALLHSQEIGKRNFRFATLDREQADAARKEGLKVVLLA
jgi:predicted nucleic acid-binding protein